MQRIRTEDGTALAGFCDVTDIDSVKNLFGRADEALGGVDIVVACAGSGPENKHSRSQIQRLGARYNRHRLDHGVRFALRAYNPWPLLCFEHRT